jgi:hypothetical protein
MRANFPKFASQIKKLRMFWLTFCKQPFLWGTKLN